MYALPEPQVVTKRPVGSVKIFPVTSAKFGVQKLRPGGWSVLYNGIGVEIDIIRINRGRQGDLGLG
jgi:hypothetical protein